MSGGISRLFAGCASRPASIISDYASSEKNVLTDLASKQVFDSDAIHDKVRIYTEAFRQRFQIVEGAVWGVSWACVAGQFFYNIREYIRACDADLTQHKNQKKLYDEIKKVFVNFVSLSGISASIATWANRARIIVLGKGVSFLQKFSYATHLITSGFGIDASIRTLQDELWAFHNAVSGAERTKHTGRYHLALIDLASHITTLAWSILGIVELCVGIALSPALMLSIFWLSCALAIASLSYSIYIEYNAEPPVVDQGPVPA